MTTLGRQHREAQLALRARTLLTLNQLWPALDLTNVPDTYPSWARAVGSVVQAGRDESADIAASYLLDVWDEADLEQGDIVRPDAIEGGRLATSLLVTSFVAYRTALGAGRDPEDAEAIAQVSNAGSMSRLVLEGGRETVVATARKDQRLGWARVVDGSPCEFCLMLADRGAVYGETTADFEAHDHCGCSAEAVVRDDAS